MHFPNIVHGYHNLRTFDTIFTKFSIWKPHRRNMTGVRFLRRSTTKPTRVLRFESTNCKTGWCAGEVCEHTVDMWVLLTLGTVWRRKLNVHHYMNLLSWADRTTYALSSLASCLANRSCDQSVAQTRSGPLPVVSAVRQSLCFGCCRTQTWFREFCEYCIKCSQIVYISLFHVRC